METSPSADAPGSATSAWIVETTSSGQPNPYVRSPNSPPKRGRASSLTSSGATGNGPRSPW